MDVIHWLWTFSWNIIEICDAPLGDVQGNVNIGTYKQGSADLFTKYACIILIPA